MKPVFSKYKKEIETAYFKLKMNNNDITTQFLTDKKQNETVKGEDIVSKYGSVTPMIHIRSIYYGVHESTDYNASV